MFWEFGFVVDCSRYGMLSATERIALRKLNGQQLCREISCLAEKIR